jgi:hypothetical protein
MSNTIVKTMMLLIVVLSCSGCMVEERRKDFIKSYVPAYDNPYDYPPYYGYPIYEGGRFIEVP